MKVKCAPFLTNAYSSRIKIVKVPDFLKWQVVLSEVNVIQEWGLSSEDELSILGSKSEVLYTKLSDDLGYFPIYHS